MFLRKQHLLLWKSVFCCLTQRKKNVFRWKSRTGMQNIGHYKNMTLFIASSLRFSQHRMRSFSSCQEIINEERSDFVASMKVINQNILNCHFDGLALVSTQYTIPIVELASAVPTSIRNSRLSQNISSSLDSWIKQLLLNKAIAKPRELSFVQYSLTDNSQK